MGSFGAVIPITGLNLGFLGQVSRTGGGDPFIVAKFANTNNVNNIAFGDTVALLPDSAGGTYRQFADFLANGGSLSQSVTLASSVTATPSSMAELAVGMFVVGSGIPAGTFITAVGTSTITLSKSATSTGAQTLTFGWFAGIAVREVKTQLTYPVTPGASQVGVYQPGQMCEVLVRGSITAKVTVGTPVAGGPVYMRTILNGSIAAGIVGDLEAAPDTVNTVVLPNAYFKTGVLDANNVSEVTLLSRAQV
jgi:hypothetical protein